MSPSIHHLEPFPHFLQHVVALNRVHAPDDPVHDMLLLDEARWRRLAEDGPDLETLAGRALRARRALAAIHGHFLAGAPAHEQGAYLLRAFSALRPFDEANHRTAWDYLAETLRHHRHELMASEEEGRVLAGELWEHLGPEPGNGLDRTRLQEPDAAFDHAAAWLRPRIA